MDVEEVKKLKHQLEQDISELIVNFNKKTGVSVKALNADITSSSFVCSDMEYFVRAISIELHI